MSKSIPYRHYIRALSQWPKDALRPDCQFQTILERSINRRFLGAEQKDKEGKVVKIEPEKIDKTRELEQVNALYSLLGNRYSQKYKLSKEFMRPQSDPDHYTNLVKELEEAPKRSWWGNLVNKWRGAVRYQ
ncbi:hypothetical protein BGZ60DRAFT_425193 [Tricladium varicosporioides]|nr:hypothetical protein BGZ60DRAFT_425193 [Hymenoscyphus varicosporioides]